MEFVKGLFTIILKKTDLYNLQNKAYSLNTKSHSELFCFKPICGLTV